MVQESAKSGVNNRDAHERVEGVCANKALVPSAEITAGVCTKADFDVAVWIARVHSSAVRIPGVVEWHV